MSRPGGLGRGLGALLPAAEAGQSGLLTLPLTAIVPNPRQPRQAFDDDALAELAHSLREVGLLQPIVVRPMPDGRYEIVAGERRFRAAGKANLTELPAIVRHTEDSQLLTEALVENIHRADLNPLEEAAAYRQLLDDFGMTHEALAHRLGRSRSAISNALRLLGLAPEVQEVVIDGRLSAGHARAIAGIEDREAQARIVARAVAEGWSVRQTEDAVRLAHETADAQAESASRGHAARAASPFPDLQRRLSDVLATKVAVKGSARRGRLVIDYSGTEDLERLLDILGRGAGTDLLAEDA